MTENRLPVHYTSAEKRGRVQPSDDSGNGGALAFSRDSKLGKWLLSSAVISVTTLFTICNPKPVPSFVAQTTKSSKQLLVPGVGPAAPASVKDVDRSTAQHNGSSSGAHRTVASDTKAKPKPFMVPPPPPTPFVLPPEFGLFPMQPAQQYEARQQHLQQAQSQDSPLTHNQSAAGENSPQQSDQELQAADQELEAALRSSLLTESKWSR